MKSKKIVGLAVSLGLAASTLLGALPASAEDKVITVWADGQRGPNLVKTLGSLESQKGGEWVAGYKVKVVSFSSFDALKAAVDNITKDGPDVIVGANDWVPTLAGNGKLAPYTPSAAVRKNFNPNNWFDLTYKNRIYGVPVDVNNVAMLVNTKLTGKKPTTFGEMVDYYLANKSSKGLKAGLCVAGGGMSWGAHSVLSALGGGAYPIRNAVVDTRQNPVPATVATNIQKYLLDSKGASNGFFPASDTGCKDNFLAGKVPYAIIGNWEWKDYVDKGFSMNNLMAVPGVKKGTFGAAFGSVSGAMLTSFAEKNGNDAAAKSLLANFFASEKGQVAYQKFELRPPANKAAAAKSSAAQKGFGGAAASASVPQIGAILNGSAGNASYWDALPSFWNDVLVKKVAPGTAVSKLNNLFKKNIVAGVKIL
ncbi:extracellular solute-binding protein [Aquiluna sp. KACHI24]|uniref:sugar ABC transporter substrate-binding protein n=1 Tax=Aquiluna sp. KACHI24 TaxID=2968831 RepID=UPI00220CD015|nr:extracellular solute-binding protein [Aquiluna sp. KACHI24]BDQ00843.1 maltose ABC transporter substrate-binding protein MalE [Aquiluna sp. KACHI24]